MHTKSDYVRLSPELNDDFPIVKAKRTCSWVKACYATVLIACVALTSVLWYKQKKNTAGARVSTIYCGKQQLRREWRTLQPQEKTEYIKAVQCTSSIKSQVVENGTVYDDFAWVHALMSETKETDHGLPIFLPFHRYLLHTYEQILRERCGYNGTLVYWDWTLDWNDLPSAPIWDTDVGFGGDGDPLGEVVQDHGRCVTTGPFKDLRPKYHNTKYKPHCLSRGFRKGIHTGRTFPGEGVSPAKISDILTQASFDEMSHGIEMGPHNFIPFSIRGDFFSFSSPYEPLFFLHHAQLDRLWWTWQQQGRDRTLEYGVNGTLDDIINMHGLNSNRQVREVMSSDSNLMCYRYS